jgi:hypothetical protein
MTFKKIILGIMVAALSLTLATGVFAATSKSTRSKKSTKKTVKKTQKKTVKRYSGDKKVAKGSNVSGRTGLIWTQTADTVAKGKFAGAAHLTLMTTSNSMEAYGYKTETTSTVFDIPVGGKYGVAPNIELGASIDFMSISSSTKTTPAVTGAGDGDDSSSGLNDFTFGGKYVIEGKKDPVNFGFGMDISVGPMSDDFGDSSADFNPMGLVTYEKDAMVLNGMLGFVITGAEGADDFVQFGAGAGLALSPKLTGMVELGINSFGKEASVLGVGIRTASKTQLQAFLGLGLGDAAPDFVLGAGVCF